MIDLLIVSYNGKELTKQAIESAISNIFIPAKIIVVDNHSKDGSVEFIKENFKFVECISLDQNVGYGNAVNIGFKRVVSPFVVVSNNDVIFPRYFFKRVIEIIRRVGENFGVLGFQQIYPDGSFQNSYGRFHTLFSAFLDISLFSLFEVRFKKLLRKFRICKKLRKVDYIDGAVMCINRKAFEDVAGFDKDFFFYSEEVDLCKRMKEKGFSNLFDPMNEVIHYRGQGKTNRIGLSENSVNVFVNSRLTYCKKHLSKIETKLYLLLQALFYQEISLMLRIRKIFSKSSNSDQVYITKLVSKEFTKKFKEVELN